MTSIRYAAFWSSMGIILAAALPGFAAGEERAKGFFVRSRLVAPAERRDVALQAWLRDRLDAKDDEAMGSGGRVWGLLVVQTQYDDEDGRNEFELTWSNDLINPGGLGLLVNGVAVVAEGTELPVVLDGLSTGTTIYGTGTVGVGPLEVEVVGAAGSAIDSIVGLASQPFDDPNPLTCKDGPRNPRTLACSMILDIPAQRQPDFYFVTFDGTLLDETIPGKPSHTFKDVKQGAHTVGLLGAISADGNDYLGDYTETTCDIACVDLPCDKVYDIDWCQTAFGPSAPDNKAHLTWENGELLYESLSLTLDALEPIPLAGDAIEATLENLAPGAHTVSIEGDCGTKGKSGSTTLTFDVAGQSPQGDPLKDLACRFVTPSGESLVATWKNLTSADSIDVIILNTVDEQRLDRTIAGESTSVAITGTSPTDRIALRFHYSGTGSCYTSPLQICTPTPPPGQKYLLGDCDGNSNFDITDAIFSLNHLFRGGGGSPCERGCDSNSDSIFNLADGIYSLNHLFRGGPPPGGSFPECDQAPSADPICGQTTCNR